MTHMHSMRHLLAGALTVLLVVAGAFAQAGGRLVPPSVPLNESASRALQAEWLTAEERASLRVFHGVWDDRDLISPELRAIASLHAWHLNDPVFDDDQTPAELRAEARLLRGDVEDALELLAGVDSIHADRIRAEALEVLGRFEEADVAIDRPVRQLMRQQIDEANELTDGVRALIVRSRLRGQPARDFQTMLDLLGRAHQELDRLYWPAKLIEGLLLIDKSHRREAVDALYETLSLNPRCSEAWYALGLIAADTFDFDSAQLAAANLRRLNPNHPLADLLLAEARLTQDDPDGAIELINQVTKRYPRMRAAHELYAAAQAILYDLDAMERALARYDELSPGSARAYYAIGRHLSFNRQYELAAEILEEAIRRQPKWPAPQIEQGLMELQSGRDAVALSILRDVRELDPFDRRATNSLSLLEEIAGYNEIETEHFIIRYKPGIDEVMVELMPEALERLHRVVTDRFGFSPDRRTVIEVMPDHSRFAVRITGMPHIHTIAACTGPVIAMEVPRQGTGHTTIYDWPRVVQHEYTHTVTLAQTQNRIPHWLTEAAAVEMEHAPRDYQTWQLLARSFEDGTLFNLDEIKWAFVRPRRPEDRSKAYAQGHWMLQYMNDRFGKSALIRLLERYFDGEREEAAFPNAIGITREQFYRSFLEWAKDDLRSVGMLPEPSMGELMDSLRMADPDIVEQMRTAREARLQAIARAVTDQIGQPDMPGRRLLEAEDWPDVRKPPVDISDDQLEAWLEQYPDHPDLHELKVRRAIVRQGGRADATMIPLLERYAELRPVDPMPHQRLAQLYLASDEPWRAIRI
jgi:cellulose synthase operon protein C